MLSQTKTRTKTDTLIAETLSMEGMIHKLINRIGIMHHILTDDLIIKIETLVLQIFHNDPTLLELDLSDYFQLYNRWVSHSLLNLFAKGIQMNTNLIKVSADGKSNSI
jgi:hypothetical protein